MPDKSRVPSHHQRLVTYPTTTSPMRTQPHTPPKKSSVVAALGWGRAGVPDVVSFATFFFLQQHCIGVQAWKNYREETLYGRAPHRLRARDHGPSAHGGNVRRSIAVLIQQHGERVLHGGEAEKDQEVVTETATALGKDSSTSIDRAAAPRRVREATYSFARWREQGFGALHLLRHDGHHVVAMTFSRLLHSYKHGVGNLGVGAFSCVMQPRMPSIICIK
ncbi:hypothetical protein QBC39DRAFT_71454 [Podospora conica]|nr:hypothetical protein QBC39DRAFT_71454 [Schizothecium conicum]